MAAWLASVAGCIMQNVGLLPTMTATHGLLQLTRRMQRWSIALILDCAEAACDQLESLSRVACNRGGRCAIAFSAECDIMKAPVHSFMSRIEDSIFGRKHNRRRIGFRLAQRC